MSEQCTCHKKKKPKPFASPWRQAVSGGAWWRTRKRFAVELSRHPKYWWWIIRVLGPKGKEVSRTAIETSQHGAMNAATRALRKHAP